jgi:hypothetical protein
MNQSKENIDTLGWLVLKMLEDDGFFDSLKKARQNLPVILNSLASFFSLKDELTKKVLTILGHNGWYISLKMIPSSTFELAQKIETGNVKDVDKIMCQFYRKHLKAIKNEISKISPARSFILRKAFIAHRRRHYELSIPVFLSQADGICQELSGHQLYKKSKKKPSTAQFVEQLKPDSYAATLLEPLRVSMPISESTEKRLDSSLLNRHAVLHGVDVNYANETNSYKAISILMYVSSVLNFAKKP